MSSVPSQLECIFETMVETGASDLHWSDGGKAYFRINGFLEEITLPPNLKKAEFSNLTKELLGEKCFADFVKHQEYDGAATVCENRRIRINAYFKADKIAWAIRLLPERFFELEELGLNMDVCQQICEMKQGLVLVTGATGSGKTTTLASILHHINRHRREHIFTIEDPVEYIHRSQQCLVSQREIGRDTQSYHAALRGLLREDPDIVLLGEMRDRESMDAALTLAETGHLTFATLHTSGAVDTISRIISAFESMEQAQARERIATNLRVVITQQLIPWGDREGRSLCPEIMVSTKAVRAMIRDGKERQIPSSMETGSKEGMTTMNKSLAELVRRHLVPLCEALQYSPDRDGMMRLL